MKRQFADEKEGFNYILQRDYYLPDLALPKDTETRAIGFYGERHGHYLKKHRKAVYMELLTSGKLHAYLADIDEQARERLELLVKQLAEKEGVTEKLKAENQMEWISKMNNIPNRAMKIVNNEITNC